MDSSFDRWSRKPTNTERVVSKLIAAGLPLEPPQENADMYRVQVKVTGCESRHALCRLNRHSGCEDIHVFFDGIDYAGIDLLGPVKELASSGIELIGKRFDDPFLWVCLSSAANAGDDGEEETHG